MDEITTSQKLINSVILLGGGFMVFYILIYGVLWLGVAIFGGVVKQDDEDVSFLDGDGTH